MAVVSIGNVKGGAGKTTIAVLLAMEFARRGEPVVLLDCDPLAFATRWRQLPGHDGSIDVISGITFSNLAGIVRAQKAHAQVIIDLSSARDAVTALAAAFSDLVLIPVQGCAMDAQGGAHVLDLIDQVERNSRCRINHAVVLTRVSPIITTRAIRSVKALLAARNVHLLDTPLVERGAYRDMFDHGGSLYDMDASKVSNVSKALINMQSLARDVLRLSGRTPEQAVLASSTGRSENTLRQSSPGSTAKVNRPRSSRESAMRLDS